MEKIKKAHLRWIFLFSLLALLCSGKTYAQEVNLQSSFSVNSNWGTGYNASITITNNTTAAVSAWRVDFDLAESQSIESLWNGKYSINSQHVTVTNENWNGVLNPGQSLTIGFGVNNPLQTSPGIIGLTAKGNPSQDSGGGNGQQAFSLNAFYEIESAWQTGYQVKLTLKNPTAKQASSWIVSFELPEGQTIANVWSGDYSTNGRLVTIKNPKWFGGGSIASGAAITIGFVVNDGTSTRALYNLNAMANSSSIQPPTQVPVPTTPVLNSIAVSSENSRNYTVSWNSVPYADEYSLEVDSTAAFSNPKVVTKDMVLSQSFSNQLPGTYYYRVSASNESGTSPFSNSQKVVIEEELPSVLQKPVLEEIVNPIGEGNYLVKWSAVPSAEGYILEESISSRFTDARVVFRGNNTSYEVLSQYPGVHYYRVKAYAGTVSSSPSNIASVEVFQSTPSVGTKKIVGYYTNWSMYRTPSFKPENINANLITHINYAFVKVDASGNVSLFDSWADIDYRTDWNTQKPYWGNFRQLYDLKQKHPHLKTLFSVGGWTLSDPFSAMAASPQARQNFIRQSIEFCEKYNFDGIDIDWEYPGFAEHSGRPQDMQNFTLLLKELSIAAQAHSPKLLVTIAAPAGPEHYRNIELDKIHAYLDWINLMCYDFAGPGWTPITNHHSALFRTRQGEPLFNCKDAINHYLSQGVPSDKIVVGMPLYGRTFANVYSNTDGLFSSYSGAGSGTTSEAGLRFFSDIKKNLLRTYTRYWDDTSKVPYLFNPTLREFVTYDDEESLAIKCQYIKQKALGGAMVWELGLDVLPTWDAMSTIYNELR